MVQRAVQPITYHGWRGSLKLTNGVVELIVVPALGRIMRYGFPGGPNLIWEDPALAGQPANRRTFPRFGGNKAWPWPQDEWPAHIGHDWPPPPAADQAEYTSSIIGPSAVRLKSPLLVGFGMTIVREIQLSPKGTQVMVTTRLEHISSGGPAQNLAAWSITPAAAPETLLVRLTPGSPLPTGYKPLGAFDPFASVTAENRILRVVRQPDKSSKIGIDGDVIGAVYGDTLWLLRDQTPKVAGEYQPGERVQVFASADSREDTARGLPPYMELEMTSPRKRLARDGDSVALTEVWELRKLSGSMAQRNATAEKIMREL